MKIGKFDTRKKVLIVAEIGNNHEGSFSQAAKMVKAAAQAGVDAVKFQTYKTEYFISRRDTARYERLKKFELTQDEFFRLKKLAASLGLLFLSTPLDLESARFLNGIVDAFKISSGDDNFYPLISKVLSFNKPVLISSGLSELDEIQRTYRYIQRKWGKKKLQKKLGILHCVSSYPTLPVDVNLKFIPFLLSHLRCPVGYSDHTLGLTASMGAVCLGAVIIEKHFTLDKNTSDFRDHQLSCDPDEMKQLVKSIRDIEKMMGKARKPLSKTVKGTKTLIRRSAVYKRSLMKGEQIRVEDITWVRPGGGISPGKEAWFFGRTLKKDVQQGDQLAKNQV